MNAMGADFSFWQDNNATPQPVNFTLAKQNGLDFVYIKSSQAALADEDFKTNWSNAKTAGLLRGAYHFFVWSEDPLRQANTFTDLIKGDPGELPPMADFEWWQTTPPNAVTLLKVFCEQVDQVLGRTCGVYTGPYFWMQNGSKDPDWANRPLWIAHWQAKTPIVPPPWKAWTFWQYTNQGDGSHYGAESAQLDLDTFNGSLDDLTHFYQQEKPTDPLLVWAEEVDKFLRTLGYNGPGPGG